MPIRKFRTTPLRVNPIKTRFREIRTSIPAPGTEKTLARLAKYESRSMHGQLPIVWQKAENASVFDCSGNKWIDFTSGIFVTNVGHSNKAISKAIKNVTVEDFYCCYAYPNIIRAD